MKEEQIFFQSSGITLEGLLKKQEAFSLRGGVVLCHPHPQYGGDMYNPVIASGVRSAQEAGFSTLRFNFRGVGKSGGTYSEGVGESEDVQAAFDTLSAELGGPNQSLVLLGYSFGAWVGAPVAVLDGRIQGMVIIAPPLQMYDFSFLKGCKKRKQIIVGSEDSFCPAPLLDEWYQTLEEPKSLDVLQGADHFFFAHQQSLLPLLLEFFTTF